MTIKPAFLPEGLISLEQARDEVGADILGTLLVENRLAGICFDPFGSYTPIYPTVWATDAGRQIMDTGVVPFGIAHQVGVMNHRDEDIGVFVDKHTLFANVEVVCDNNEAVEVDEKPKNKGGRPSLPWDDFFIEVIRIANSPDGLPEQQADLEKLMVDWCERHWADKGSLSSVRARLTKVYAALADRPKR